MTIKVEILYPQMAENGDRNHDGEADAMDIAATINDAHPEAEVNVIADATGNS